MAPERATTNVNGADMAEVMQTMRDMATAMAQQATATTLQAQTLAQKDAQRQQREEELATARGLAEFRRHNPPKFEGDHDPDKADLWLQEIEKIFEVLHCTGETKMEYATFLLTGEAECWWRGAKGIMQKNGEELTWEVFRQKFLDKYFPKSARAQKEAQFLSLYQGNMTVAEYAKKFESLARYFRFFNNQVDEDYKCERFESGLRYDIKEVVAPHEIRQYEALVEKCKKVENLKRSRPNRDSAGGPVRHQGNQYSHNKSRQQGPYTRPQGNGRDQDRAQNGGGQRPQNRNQNQNQPIRCFRCQEEGHKSYDCPFKPRSCYICLKPDHFANNCPERNNYNPKNNNSNNQAGRPTAQGRVYHIGGEDTRDSSELIQGTKDDI